MAKRNVGIVKPKIVKTGVELRATEGGSARGRTYVIYCFIRISRSLENRDVNERKFLVASKKSISNDRKNIHSPASQKLGSRSPNDKNIHA